MADNNLGDPCEEVKAGTGVGKTGGRPIGAKTSMEARRLQHHHFSFLRALIEGVDFERAWAMYLAQDSVRADRRSMGRQARELLAALGRQAKARGLEAQYELAVQGVSARIPRGSPAGRGLGMDGGAGVRTAAAERPALPATEAERPTLDEWIESECQRQGIGSDFMAYREWAELYETEFGEPGQGGVAGQVNQAEAAAREALGAVPAIVHARQVEVEQGSPASAALKAQLEALSVLGNALEGAVRLDDGLGAWLRPELAQALAQARHKGRPMPLSTVEHLIVFINMRHARWWTGVPGLGRVRAQRLVEWLAPQAERLGRPLQRVALMAFHDFERKRSNGLRCLAEISRQRFGLVPMRRLAVPPGLDGRHGALRGITGNALQVETDLEAIQQWLDLRKRNERTHQQYERVVERFYLWCLLEKRKALSSASQRDLLDYQVFLASPPAHWVQEQRMSKEAEEWRPFKGTLSGPSIRLEFKVIGGLFGYLHKTGYLRVNPAADVPKALGVSRLRIDTSRSFDEAQWHWLMAFWERQYAAAMAVSPPLPSPIATETRRWLRAASLRRIKLLLELGATTGLRLVEIITTRRDAVKQVIVDGQLVWLIEVLGKGGRAREVVLYDDVRELLEQHHRDVLAADVRGGSGYRTLANPAARPAGYEAGFLRIAADGLAPSVDRDPVGRGSGGVPGEGELALIGALRKPPKRWTTGALGEAVLQDPSNADRGASLDPSALHQTLKRFLVAAARVAEREGEEIDAGRLKRASAHWLRHFCGTSMAADNVNAGAMMSLLGHSSLGTTSVYIRPERKQLVSELGKVKRRR